jgi:hypothetical protein
MTGKSQNLSTPTKEEEKGGGCYGTCLNPQNGNRPPEISSVWPVGKEFEHAYGQVIIR